MTNITTQREGAPGAYPSQNNPFAVQRHENINQGTIAIEEQRAIAEVQGKLLIAKRFTRDQAEAFERVMQSCSRKGLAEQAIYAYPRGGQTITGPSIRLAEEIARAWGNIEYGIRELSQREGISEMEAYCWDLETNVVSSQKFTVKHERHTRQGVTKLVDPRDIYELTANQAGRRLRARILAVLPPDLVEAAKDQVAKTLAGNSTEPIADTIRKLITAFSKYGVNKSHIETKIGKKVDELLSDELVELRAIYTSIRDSVTKPSDWFNTTSAPVAEPPAIGDLGKEAGKRGRKANIPAPAPEPPANDPPAPEPPVDEPPVDEPPAPNNVDSELM